MSQWSTYQKPDPLIQFDEGRLNALRDDLRGGSSDSREIVKRMRLVTGQDRRYAWSGLAADAFFTEVGDLPEDLAKLIQSYGFGYQAVDIYIYDLRSLEKRADSCLELISRYEGRIDSLEWELAVVPPEEEDRRRELESEIDSRRGSVDYQLGQANTILSDLDEVANEFASAMSTAQDVGIHNRNIFVKIYQDHVEIWVESFLGAWEDIGPWVDVLTIILMVVPGGQPFAAALKGLSLVLGAVAITLKAIDIVMSDDDAGFMFFVEAGMTVVGLGAAGSKKLAGQAVINNWGKGLSLVSKGGSAAASRYKMVSRIDTVVEIAGDLYTAVDSGNEIGSRLAAGTPWSDDSVWSSKSADLSFEDPFWSADRLLVTPLITTPTLVEIEVDVESSANTN